MHESDRFHSYLGFNGFLHEPKSYLTMPLNRQIKNIVVKFRFGISELFVHSYRYKNLVNINLGCPLCRLDTENEVHFLLCCSSLTDLREKLIPEKYRNPNRCQMNLLLASKNEVIV
jgi:hypothetical protein